jgi:LmbE family N-acetylglucosaminyl deacetylase
LIVPLAVGRHIDHRNTRLAAEYLGLPLHYYADFPYAAMDPAQVNTSVPEDATPIPFDISDQALEAWQDAIACYSSQISSFWSSLEEMRSAVAEYASQPLARTLWKKSKEKQERRWPNTMN